MKKTILGLIMSTAVILLAGCAGGKGGNETTAPVTTETVAEQTTGSTAQTTAQTTESTEQKSESTEQTSEQTTESTAPAELPHSDKFTVTQEGVSFTDQLDREVTIAQKPERVIVLDYNELDLWYYGGGTAVGRTDHILVQSRAEDEIGSQIAKLDVLNDAHDPVNMEILVEKDPDLVILNPTSKTHLDIVPLLESQGIPYFAWDYDNFDGFLENLELFTLINDRADLYEKYASDNITRIDKVLDTIRGQEPVDMVMLLPSADQGAMALVNKGYLGNICDDLNTINVAFQNVENPKNGVISMETLIELDPSFIFSRGGSGDGSTETALGIYQKSPLWSELTAVKEGRFDHLPAELFLYHANTRYADAYEYMAKLLYPDLFDGQ